MVKFHDAQHYLRDSSRPLKVRFGGRVENLRGLAEALDLMDDKAFKAHTKGKKNDLAALGLKRTRR